MSIELQSLSCNNCGAAVAVADNTRFVTCAHCGSRLSVVRTGDSAFTETLQQIAARTAKIADRLDQLQDAEEEKQLEERWKREREAFLLRSMADTEVAMPFGPLAIAGGVATMIAAVVVGIVLGDDSGLWVGVIGVGVGVVVCLLGVAHKRLYDEAEALHQQRQMAAMLRKKSRGRAVGDAQH